MKANTLVATKPGVTSGNRIRQNTVHAPAPSIAAASSSSLGTDAAKLRSIQIVTGNANAVYSAMTSACCGSICTISNMIRYVVRKRNLKRASAIAASSASSEETATATMVTNRLLRRKVQYGMGLLLLSVTPVPSMTWRKLSSVGCSGIGCGVSENSSVGGLKAVEII